MINKWTDPKLERDLASYADRGIPADDLDKIRRFAEWCARAGAPAPLPPLHTTPAGEAEYQQRTAAWRASLTPRAACVHQRLPRRPGLAGVPRPTAAGRVKHGDRRRRTGVCSCHHREDQRMPDPTAVWCPSCQHPTAERDDDTVTCPCGYTGTVIR